MFLKNLSNYCWRHAFVTLITDNLQWLDRLIAVSRYLRYAAFNIVKNVMSHNIVSSYRGNTLHHHTISNIQINKVMPAVRHPRTIPTFQPSKEINSNIDTLILASWWQVQQTCPDGSNNMAQYNRMFVKMI